MRTDELPIMVNERNECMKEWYPNRVEWDDFVIIFMKHSKMECLENEPTQVWPYGWETLKQYSRWGVEDGIIQAMINGDFVKTIMEYVKKIVNEIDSKALPMP